MKNKYLEHLDFASSIDNSTEQLMYLTSLLRSLLQTATIITFELAKRETSYDEVGLVEFINRFLKPVDGLPLEIFTHLTPLIRDNINNTFLLGWFEETKTVSPSLDKQLRKWIEFRNKKPAHGVLDKPTAEEWSIKTENIIKDCLIVFNSIIPSIDKAERFKFSKEFKNLEITVPLIYDNNVFTIQHIVSKKGIWKLKGQVLSLVDAKEFTIDLSNNNIFSTQGLESTEKYPYISFINNNEEHILQHNIPIRQTDIFVGRESELKEINDWMNDEDSRACSIYGDGGYGKTTLVLEFFNKMIESEFDFEKNPPLIISYYTAKKTRWNEDGLLYLPNTNLAMDECIRELMRCFYPILPKAWYSITGSKIIDKAKSVLVDNKYERDDILFIIDNTETLASTQTEIKELNTFFNLIRKKLGRIIITSRRRESFEAKQLQIQGLSDTECISLLKELGKVYKANSINQSGDRSLQKISKQLMNKPLLLEALVKYIAHSNLGIDRAIKKIFNMSNEQLLEFLYEDAWLRMNDLQKEVFYVMIYLQSPLDENSIGKICQEIQIQYSEFLEALEETHFAIEVEYSQSYTLQLIDLAQKFFLLQFQKLTLKEKDNFKRIAQKVDKYSIERQKIENEYKTDRVAEAFRSEFAKSARIFADKGDNDKAFGMYELALEDDPLNSALHDKFSWFLLNRTQEFDYAKILSEKAVKLNTNNIDATVGLALVYYRLGEIEHGDKYIDKAQKLGRSLSFCLLRKGIARYHKAKKSNIFEEQVELLENTLKLLKNSEIKNANACGYDRKNLDDTTHYLNLSRRLLTNIRSENTREINQKIKKTFLK